MSTIKVKTSDLSGIPLRYAVAKACRYEVVREVSEEFGYFFYVVTNRAWITEKDNGLVGYIRGGGIPSIYDYKPEMSWSICGSLISWCGRHYGMFINAEDISASVRHEDRRAIFKSNNLRTAICRAFVFARLGDEIEVPAELIEGGVA